MSPGWAGGLYCTVDVRELALPGATTPSSMTAESKELRIRILGLRSVSRQRLMPCWPRATAFVSMQTEGPGRPRGDRERSTPDRLLSSVAGRRLLAGAALP